MADLNITGKVTVDASQAEGAFDRVGDRAVKMSGDVAAAAGKAGNAAAQIGAGSERGEQALTRSQSRMRDEIQRSTRSIEQLGKTASQRLELKIQTQGLDPALFAPYLAQLREVERSAAAANGSLGQLETGSASLGKAFGLLAAAAAALGLQQAFASVINEQETMQRNMLRTEALLRANGQAANLSSAQLRTNAQELALATLQSVEGVEQAQQILLTFTNVVGSTFLRATELAADLATVTGGGLTGSMTMLGKALNDPIAGITAMTRAGVSFTAQQKDTIKELVESNKLLDAQTIILDELSRQYGGVATAEAMGYAGAVDTLGQRVQELKIGFADFLDIGSRTSVIVNALAGQVDGLTKALKENAVAVSIGLGALAGAAAIAGVLGLSAAFGTVVTALAAVKVGFIALTAVMAANPFGLLAIGIGAAAGALVAYKSAQEKTVPGMQRAIMDLESANNGLLNLKGQAGMSAAERAGYDERVARIKELKAAVDTLKTPVITGSVGSGDTALLRANRAISDAQAQAVASFSAQNQTAVQKLNAELAKQRALMGDLFSPEIEAKIRAQYDTKVKGAGAAAAAVKREADQYAKLIGEIRAKIEANGLEAASGEKISESQKIRIKLDRDLASGALKRNVAEEQRLRLEIDRLEVSEKVAALEKARVKSMADTLKLIEDTQQADAKTVASAINAANIAEQQLAQYGLLKSEVMSLTLAQLENARESAALAGEDVANIQKRIEAQKRLIAATVGKDALEAADKTAKDALEASTKAAADATAEWQKTADSINTSLTDALMRGFESGKGFAENLRDTLKNMFSTLVLRPIISAVLAPVAGALTGAANAATGAIGGGGSATSLMSSLNSSISGSIEKSFGEFARSSSGQSLGLSESSAMGPLPGGGSLTANGQLASQGLQVLGDTMAGYALGSMARTMISGGYSMGNGMDNFQKVGIAVASAIGGPVFGAIAGAVAGGVNRLFGRKLQDTGLSGAFGGASGFEGQNFQDLKGGVFRSDKTKTNPLAEEARAALGDAFAGMRVQVGTFASALGLNTDQIAGFTSTIKLSLKGLSEADADKKIKEALGAAGNSLAAQVLGDSGFARAGEEAGATLQRLASSLMTVNAVFDTLGKTALEASLAGGDLASKLADAFGGLENLASATSTYYEAFYSEAERTATATRQLTETLGKLGIALPNTGATDALAQYRALVDAQDINTEAGRTAYAALVTLSGGFAQLVTATEELGRAAAEAAKASMSAAVGRTNAAFAALERAVDAQRKTIGTQISAAQSLASEVSSIFDALKSSVDDLYRSVDSTAQQSAQQARAFITQALSGALATGALPDSKALQDAVVSAIAGIDSQQFVSQFESDRARLVLAGELRQLKDIAGDQLSEAERQIRLFESQLEALDKTLQAARDQIDVLSGIDTRVLSVKDAIDALAAAILAQKSVLSAAVAPTASAYVASLQPGKVFDASVANPMTERDKAISDIYASTLGRLADAGGLNDWSNSLLSIADIASGIAASTEASMRALGVPQQNEFIRQVNSSLGTGGGIPAFAVGTNYVPRDMTARIHKGEMIVPAAFNPATSGMGGNNERLERLVEGLTAEVSRLRADVSKGNENTKQLADQFDSVSAGGNALATEVMP